MPGPTSSSGRSQPPKQSSEPWLGAPARGSSEGYSRFLIRTCHEAGFEPSIAFEPDDLWTGRGIIAAGLAVGLMPGMAFTIPHPGIAIVRLAGTAPARSIRAVHMPGRRVPANAAMIQCLRQAFSASPQAAVAAGAAS